MKPEPRIRAARCVSAATGLLLAGVSMGARADSWFSGVAQYRSDMVYQSVQMMTMVAIAGVLAIVVAVPVGIYMSRPSQRHGAAVVMQTLNVGQAIPKLALLALAMSALGIGSIPAIFGLWVATLLPIALNTYEGLRAVPRSLIEAATGMGMTPLQILLRVELPNALYVIFAGIRTALAITVGTAPLAFLIGGGGLGELIFTGIDLNDFTMLLAGAIPTALLAILTDAFVGQMQRRLVSRGVTSRS
ncbi:ABC transporter permease [Paraburkholderia gardini]|jgi:osmoprotectant transport system permease protein|uniref:Osmoprotectant import permease protein OsmY n=1 Tax=Paraburkholderia gardini TaxID=2823469 RepID=A0ABM8U9Z2_9BURK|nr:ABC transporter permease [Paraburkholderia gardini]CAG4890744.1 Osmoprotectant import permease protein OsmY [Paraburkholderia gardini]CAG4921261.1 Osmoprotectant import permease protein OsmY [Paraburkholderia gardini]